MYFYCTVIRHNTAMKYYYIAICVVHARKQIRQTCAGFPNIVYKHTKKFKIQM